MIEKILGVGNGVRHHRLIRETFVQNLKDQKTDFTGTNLHNQEFRMLIKHEFIILIVKIICIYSEGIILPLIRFAH